MQIAASLNSALSDGRRPNQRLASAHWALRRASGSLLYESAARLPVGSAVRDRVEQLGDALDFVFTNPPYSAHRWGENIGAHSEASAINAIRRLEHIGVQATNGRAQGVDLILIAHVVNLLRPGGFLLICPINVTRTDRRVDGAALSYIGVRDRLRLWAKSSPHEIDRQVNTNLLALLELAKSAADLRVHGVPLTWVGLEFRFRHEESGNLVDSAPVIADTPVCNEPQRRLYDAHLRPFMGASVRRTLPLNSRESFDSSFMSAFGNLLVSDDSMLDPSCGTGSLALLQG